MARKKKTPRRSAGISVKRVNPDEAECSGANSQETSEQHSDKPYFVPVDRAGWDASEYRDLSEIVLTGLNIMPDFAGFELNEKFYEDPSYSLRCRLCNVNEHAGRIAFGQWPIFSAGDVYLDFGKKVLDDAEKFDVIVSGSFDGTDEGVSGLVHLASLGFLTLRPVLGFKLQNDVTSLRLRVQMLDSAFNACESLLENGKQLWKKSMMNVMAWLRPEVTTSEARYGVSLSSDKEFHADVDIVDQNHGGFNITRFYEAIKPPNNYPAPQDNLPNLLPELRPYQRRAVHWMLERERGASLCVMESQQNSPLCVAVKLLDTGSPIFYNPFSGSISLLPEKPLSYVPGGILADEMGLGKTVELLACVFSHPMPASEASISSERPPDCCQNGKTGLKRVKMERIECVCGAVSESSVYNGLWVQCDICDAWQHGDCVGYSASRITMKSKEARSEPSKKSNKRKRTAAEVVVTNGEFICKLCLELIEATKSPVSSGATVIVCPATILPQWHDEILRHTKPGSLKTYIYEGAQEASLSESSVLSLSELVNADVVLTTYEVLKEDLSHDSDRHEGDRRLMRHEKRYPVIPTPLTRVFWWRVCLDEAQMVESNVGAATEMALRLHARHRWCITGTPIQRKLDDLYGLLRFLQVSPFDVWRWWTDVIKDPYERGDAGAMNFAHGLFTQIMWRSSKENVANELKLPPQEECISWLSFSPVEEHFYERQHEACVNTAREVLDSLKNDILKRKDAGDISDFVITHLEAAKLLNSLLKLRQACCHPQVGNSGLRSIQQSPLTMDEILSVLASKTKVEGEEALRKVVSSLNGLAGIAIIRGELTHAVQLYKEALALAEDHVAEFRLDPLLNLHIHHNLAEILTSTTHKFNCIHGDGVHTKASDEIPAKVHVNGECKHRASVKGDSLASDLPDTRGCYMDSDISCETYSGESLVAECENIKKKYFSVFYSRLSQAQQDFRKSHTQVCDVLPEIRQATWWLEALHQVEQKSESLSELTRKIETAVSRTGGAAKLRSTSHFRDIYSLKYYLQTGLDALEKSREDLLSRLLEIDQFMSNPKEEDVARVRYCRRCYENPDGPLCVHCELDKLFEDYEARLFLVRGDGDGRTFASAEEAVDLQKKRSELNKFFWNLPENTKTMASEAKKRETGKKLVVSRMPSELEIILGVIRSYFKTQLGREGVSTASKHLLLLEGMRKEYAHARSLAIAQAKILHAHDEIKMATSRLRLREKVDDNSIDAIGLEELDIASVENSSEKFSSLASLSRIRGKLRYLRGLMMLKQKREPESDKADAPQSSPHTLDENVVRIDELCPICHEKFLDQRMVFQCGHAICCKCLFAMSTQRKSTCGKMDDKWVMCPTCRQHSEFGNIAFADDSRIRSSDLRSKSFDASIRVQGSYGTKIEAVTRRILWINSKEPDAKVLVFSSWNDVLNVLEHAFAANHINYVRMKGGRRSRDAIRIFREEQCTGKEHSKTTKPAQVLLLLIQHGANGLNLLEAQHVILVEPLLNPAAEAQAISRVHRIGQHKKTLIHRFMVKGSVEESIYKLNKSRNSSSFISCSKKKQDQQILTLRDIESLLASAPSTTRATEDSKEAAGSLMHLPPTVAAAIAAERRLNKRRTSDMTDSFEGLDRPDVGDIEQE